jgi:hypothetical protein
VTFGDSEPADAFDVEPADPEQVARRLLELRREHRPMERDWDDIDDVDRDVWLDVLADLLDWLRRQGAT